MVTKVCLEVTAECITLYGMRLNRVCKKSVKEKSFESRLQAAIFQNLNSGVLIKAA